MTKHDSILHHSQLNTKSCTQPTNCCMYVLRLSDRISARIDCLSKVSHPRQSEPLRMQCGGGSLLKDKICVVLETCTPPKLRGFAQARQAHNRRFPQFPRRLRQLHHQHHFCVPSTIPNLGAYRSRNTSGIPTQSSRIFRSQELIHNQPQPPLPVIFFSTANMDQAKLARMQASVRIGMLPTLTVMLQEFSLAAEACSPRISG